ncbi:hypothetical protein MTO96_015301 [Rhipicephalus appendiculatus]
MQPTKYPFFLLLQLLTMLAPPLPPPPAKKLNRRISPTFEGRFQLERHGEVLLGVLHVTGSSGSGRTVTTSTVFFFGLASYLAVPGGLGTCLAVSRV